MAKIEDKKYMADNWLKEIFVIYQWRVNALLILCDIFQRRISVHLKVLSMFVNKIQGSSIFSRGQMQKRRLFTEFFFAGGLFENKKLF